MSEVNSDSHFLDHPEVKELFSAVFGTLVAESDRGAVLVGAAHVDKHLRRLFERLTPDEVGRKRREAVLNYPGPLASFSAKADVTFFVRLINANLHAAIYHLRRIQNDVAHSPESFRLADHDAQLRGMYDLGPGVPVAINRWALELITRAFVDQVVSSDGPTDADGSPIFKTPQEVFEYLSKKPELIAILEEKRPRYELAIGVVLICALLVHHRERARKLVGEQKTLADLG